MAWKIDYSDTAIKALKNLDRQAAHNILDYMERRIGQSDDPRAYGKPLTASLTASLKGRWRLRVRDYRSYAGFMTTASSFS